MEAGEIMKIVKTIRKRLGLTQKEFGDRLGVKQQAVGLWETGLERNRPSQENLDQIMSMWDSMRNDMVDYSAMDVANIEGTKEMVDAILISGSSINKVALVASVKAFYKSCQNEVEMEGMKDRMGRLEEKMDLLISAIIGNQKGAGQSIQA